AALPALDVFHGDVIDRALTGADPADEAEALGTSQNLALDEQSLLAVGVDDHPRLAFAVLGIDVLVPDIDRLEDVSVRVDDVVRARHGRPPFGLRGLRGSVAESRTPRWRRAKLPGDGGSGQRHHREAAEEPGRGEGRRRRRGVAREARLVGNDAG